MIPLVVHDGRFYIVFENGIRTHLNTEQQVEAYIYETRGYVGFDLEIGSPWSWGNVNV